MVAKTDTITYDDCSLVLPTSAIAHATEVGEELCEEALTPLCERDGHTARTT